MSGFETILQTISQAKSFGFRVLANGTHLYGQVPHVAPEAWLHQVFAPLTEQEIVWLEEKMKLPIPHDLRQFFLLANGVGLFSVSLSIYGKKTSYVRSGDDAWQPFCILSANTLERPTHAKPSQIVIGGYQDDGSLLFLDLEDGTAFRTRSRSKKILNQWPDFWTMLKAETDRLAKLFDPAGRKLYDGSTTP